MAMLEDAITVTHISDGPEVPHCFNLLPGFRVIMRSEMYPLEAKHADGYISLMQCGFEIGVWYFAVVDSLFGPTKTHLVDLPALFKILLKELLKDKFLGLRHQYILQLFVLFFLL